MKLAILLIQNLSIQSKISLDSIFVQSDLILGVILFLLVVAGLGYYWLKHREKKIEGRCQHQFDFLMNERDSVILNIWVYDIKRDRFQKRYGNRLDEKSTLATFAQTISPDSEADFLVRFNKLKEGETESDECNLYLSESVLFTERNLLVRMKAIKTSGKKPEQIIGIEKQRMSEQKTENAQWVKIETKLYNALHRNLAIAWDYNVAQKEYTPLGGEYADVYDIQKIYESIHPLDKIVFNDFIEKLQEPNGKESDSTIIHSVAPDGAINYYHIFAVVERSPEGEALHLLGTSRDITASILNRQKMGMMTRDLYAVFNLVPSALEYYNEEGFLAEVNHKGIELFGITDRAALINKRRCFKDNPLFAGKIEEIMESKENVSYYCEINLDSEKYREFYGSTRSGKLILEIRFSNVDNAGSSNGFVAIISDVTEIMMLNRRYLQLYNENELILRSLPVGIEIYNAQGDLVYNNETDNEIYGLSESDIMYQYSRNMLTSPIVADVVKEKFSKGEDAEFEFEYNSGKCIINPEKSVKYIKGCSRILHDTEGNIDKCIVILTDITDLRRKTKELEEESIKTQVAIKTSQLVQWEYDCENQMFHSANEGNIRHLTHADYLDMIYPEDRPTIQTFFDYMDRGEDQEFNINVRLQFPGEENVQYTSINSVPFEHDKEGRVIRYVGFRKDTTSLFKLNDELGYLNRQKQLIIDNINSGLVYLTPDYTVQWENISSIFGKDASHYYKVGTVCYENFGKESPCPNCPMSRALRSKQPEIQQFVNSPDFIIEVLANPIVEEGEIVGAILRIDNITDRQRVYAELEDAKNKAEQSDKLKSAFLANMSHEIRTPLNAIVGFSDLIISAESKEEKKEYQDIIKLNSDLLLRLIGDILDLSKIESGMLDLKLARIEFSAYFNQLSITLQHKLDNPNVELRCSNPYKLCYVTIDSNRISQIITNFVTNAIKFTHRGYIEMGYQLNNNGLYIYVKDTGIGIPASKVDKIFNRFFKVNEFDQGFGLGMAICKAIVDRKQGKIGVESTEGEGSTFWVWIPVAVEIEE